MKTNRVCKDYGCTELFTMNFNRLKCVKDINGKEQLGYWMGPFCGLCVRDVP